VTEAGVALIAALVAGLVVWRVGVRGAMRKLEGRIATERAEFEALSLEDPLTGLPNKRAFEDRLEIELRRAVREYYPVSLVTLSIGTQRGQAVADGALPTLAQHVKAELRAYDICARTGDAELTIALVRVDAHSADRVVGRLRRTMETVSVGPAGEQLGFHAGIAEYPRYASTAGELKRCAAAALASAKARGSRNAVIYSPDGSQTATPSQKVDEAVQQQSLHSTLHGIAKTVDEKTRWTTGHSERVAVYAVALARSLGFSDERLDAIRQAALLHDVGKIGIRETILAKEGPLNLEEMEELQRHSELGRAMLSGAGMPELARWVNHLHERFDGDGYPYGISGREIPIESRILHVADALDQMTRPSALRRTRPLREALAELSYCSGSRVDPEIAARAIDLVSSGELNIVEHNAKPAPRRALERPRS
jgi:diguanylate cyclase (GGDEF)-like protein/putative nucleotidyltransferase with HDIG domain